MVKRRRFLWYDFTFTLVVVMNANVCMYNHKVAAAGGKKSKRTFSERALIKKDKKNAISAKHEKVK